MRKVILATAVIIAAALLFLGLPALSGRLSVSDPRFEHEALDVDHRGFPRVLRFVHPELAETRFGLVVEDENGVPSSVLDLTARWPELGSRFGTFLAADGFARADEAWAELVEGEACELVQLPGGRLAELVLSPVDIELAEIDRSERVVVGVGFNYAAHADEAGSAAVDRLAFAKAVAPTSPYADIAIRAPRGLPADADPLFDYEVELAMVVLEDLDLGRLPTDPAELDDQVAWVGANDVSARWPILKDGDAGFSAAKSLPGYLPLGPWMVHGRHLPVASGGLDLQLWLTVDEKTAPSALRFRQLASSAGMVRRPLDILGMLGQIHAGSVRRDNQGTARGVVALRDGRPVLPAGSLVLTGTPRGTAVEAPSPWDKARLVVRAGFSPSRAREAFGRHLVAEREAMGFLEPGDVVESCVQGLGCQRWQVVAGQGVE